MTIYLDMSDLIDCARSFLGTAPQVRDAGLLTAALARPQAVAYGAEVYPNFHEKAAALLISLATSRGLTTGNERLALVATEWFLQLNERYLTLSDDEFVDVIRGIADGSLADVEKVAEILENNSEPLRPAP